MSGADDLETFRRVALPGRPELHDLTLRDGVVAQLVPSPDAGTGATFVATPGLVDSHIHLEKAFLLERMPHEAHTLADAIAMTAQMKRSFTPEDIAERATRVIDAAVAAGVHALRCHVEVDDVLGLMALETVLGLAQERRAQIDLDIVAFPQEGVFTQRRGRELMEAAVAQGVDAIGGIPYNDRSVEEHLDFVFGLATRSGARLDLHLDLSDDPAQRDVVAVIERTLALGLHGRVSVGHLTSLGAMPEEEIRRIADGLAAAGISVACLPATDLHLNGRTRPTRYRGLTPVRPLLEAGVNVSLATNNVQNPFTPFGRGDLFDIAYLFGEAAHFGSAADAQLVLDMVTVNPARALGRTPCVIDVGEPASLALFRATSVRDLVLRRPVPDVVCKDGSTTVRNRSCSA